MAQVKDRDTKPELLVRSLVHRLGFRFRLHRADLPGKPDLALPRHRKVIFVHGCFWHGHRGCRRSARPTSNKPFWDKKLADNSRRDRRNLLALRQAGWTPFVVWECQTYDVEKLLRTLTEFLGRK
mgnify:CR=1 FL=1